MTIQRKTWTHLHPPHPCSSLQYVNRVATSNLTQQRSLIRFFFKHMCHAAAAMPPLILTFPQVESSKGTACPIDIASAHLWSQNHGSTPKSGAETHYTHAEGWADSSPIRCKIG
jgi:hypothetical protein